MSIEISSYLKTTAPLNGQNYINICDADGNGKLEGEELNVWEQVNSSIRPYHFNGFSCEANVGGVKIYPDSISTIKKNGEQYTIVFNNGVVAQYDKQEKNNDGEPIIMSFMSDDKTKTFTEAAYLKGNGVKITGSDKDDTFTLGWTNFSSIDGGKGIDTVYLKNAKGVADNCGKAPIKAERAEFTHESKNFSVKSETGKVENLNEKNATEWKKDLEKVKKEINWTPEKEKGNSQYMHWHPLHKHNSIINELENHGCTNYELQ